MEDLARNLASLRPSMKRLFMSGYAAGPGQDHAVLDEGASYLQKPFSLRDLADRVRQALDGEA